MADSKQNNTSVSTFATFLLVVYFMSSSQVDGDLLVDPTLIGQELQSIATNALGVDEMQVSRRLQLQICFSWIATFAVILHNWEDLQKLNFKSSNLNIRNFEFKFALTRVKSNLGSSSSESSRSSLIDHLWAVIESELVY